MHHFDMYFNSWRFAPIFIPYWCLSQKGMVLIMNKLQQEIKDFHGMLKPILEKILGQYDKRVPKEVYKNVIEPCKSLIQKCSFTSFRDTNRLCVLAYWLYIYGHKQLALDICELTHSVDFGYGYSDYSSSGILNIYGLEIRIARELLGEKRNNVKPKYLDYYFAKNVKKSLRYPQILREEEINNSYNYNGLEYYLLSALYDMIGKGETGLYKELNENWAKIEETIKEYIALLTMQTPDNLL